MVEAKTEFQTTDMERATMKCVRRLFRQSSIGIRVVNLTCVAARLVFEIQSPSYYRVQQVLTQLQSLELGRFNPMLEEIEIIATIDLDRKPLRLLIKV